MKVQSGYGVPKDQKEIEELKKKEAPQQPVQVDVSKVNQIIEVAPEEAKVEKES